jgi:ribosomal protein S11
MLGIITVYFARNNFFFTLSCGCSKKLIFSYSLTQFGFINLKKNSTQIVIDICSRVKQTNYKFFILKIKGLTKLRNLLLKQMVNSNVVIIKILDINITPFNGCKSSAKRRI